MNIIPFNRTTNHKNPRHEACSRCSIGHLCRFEMDGAPTSPLTDQQLDEIERLESANPAPPDCPIPF